MAIEGRDLSGLAHESGGHRVQRVPKGEKRGRVHSSTVTVFVRPQDGVITSDEAALASMRGDGAFDRQWYSGSGAGGQHRNKHQNSVRLRHLPTGLVATSQCRSREESLRNAQADLYARLEAMALGGASEAMNRERADAIGTGMRADKRRTWRFQEDRVLDHLTGKSARCSDVMRGRFALLWS